MSNSKRILAALLAGAMVSAAAAGSMPLWAALLGLFASVVLLNAVCGILLGASSRTAEAVLPATHNRPAVQLQVVSCELGGHVLSRDTCAVLGVVEVDVREAHALELREHAIKILVAIAKIGVDTSCKLHASTSFTFVLDRFCPFEHLIYIRNSIRAAACAPGLTL